MAHAFYLLFQMCIDLETTALKISNTNIDLEKVNIKYQIMVSNNLKEQSV